MDGDRSKKGNGGIRNEPPNCEIVHMLIMMNDVEVYRVSQKKRDHFVCTACNFRNINHIGTKFGNKSMSFHSPNGATLLSKVDSNKLRLHVKNEITFIPATLGVDQINTSKVTSGRTT